MSEYVWDYRNRLTNVRQKNSSGGAVVQEQIYRYDPMDRRIGVGSDPDGAGSQPATWQWTVYDGQNPYVDFDNSGSLTNRFLSGDAVDQFFGRFSASGTAAWYLTDQLGSVRDIANTSGSVIDHIKYDSFGKIVNESNPSNGDRFKYTAREYDATTKQYYNRARYYDSAIGRFTSEDPIGFKGGDANVYRYVGNSPTLMVDPTGQAAMPAIDRTQGPYMENPEYVKWCEEHSQSTGGGGWLDRFGGWANFLPVFGDVTTRIGAGIHSGLNGIYVPDASLANASDTTLAIGAVGTSIVGGIVIVAGGEVILGVGTLGGGGGAAAVAAPWEPLVSLPLGNAYPRPAIELLEDRILITPPSLPMP